MRVLVAYQGESAVDHPGIFNAFERALQHGDLEHHSALFWRAHRTELEWRGFWDELLARVVAERIDWVLLHQFHAPEIRVGDFLERLRTSCPNVRIAVSLGDPFCRFYHRVPRTFVQAARLADVVFLTGFGYLADQLIRSGASNLVLMPLGYCDARFGQTDRAVACEARDGIVFVGNRRLGRNPTHELFWNGLKRIRLVELLDRRYGKRFHLYGTGWEGLKSARGTLPFDAQGATYANAQVVFGGYPGVTYEYYTSNRHFIAMSEGAVMVDYWVPGVERFLKPEAHWLLFRNKKELIQRIDSVLDGGADEAQQMAARGQARVRAHFSKSKLTESMIQLWRDFDESRAELGSAAMPQLPYVLPEYSGAAQAHHFVRNWVG